LDCVSRATETLTNVNVTPTSAKFIHSAVQCFSSGSGSGTDPDLVMQKRKKKKLCFEELNVISGWLQASPGACKNFMETYIAFFKI
jgi:hypothetical protein